PGFGRDAAGEAMMNAFRWGLDNRFHVATSLGGGNVRRAGPLPLAPSPKRRRGERPSSLPLSASGRGPGGGVSSQKPVSVRGQGFLFDPRRLAFEVTSGGGQHGMSMDDWGRTFVCE